MESSDTDTYDDDEIAAASQNSAAPSVKAKSAVLMDAETGKVLFESASHDKQSPASLTKIMTLLLVMEALDSGKISLDDVVVTSEFAAEKGGSQIWLEPGEEMSVDDLLKATAVNSANDASVALAEHIAGSEESFVAAMNDKAHELGMMDTNFENCTGLDDTSVNHVTSAYDVALMSRALLKHPDICRYTTIWMDTLRNGETDLINTNKLIRFYEGANGIKTGTTSKAGCCLSASALRDGMQLIAVVLGSDYSQDRFNGATSMLNWGFANFSIFTPVIDSAMLNPVEVTGGVEKYVMPYGGEAPKMIIRKGSEEEVQYEYLLNQGLEAPVKKGQVIGRVNVTLNGEELGQIQLLASEDVVKMTFGTALIELMSKIIGA